VTALHRAAGNGSLECVELLLGNGACVRPAALSEEHQTALHWAAQPGHTAVAAALLAAGLDPAARDENGQRAADLAAAAGHAECAQLLVAGAVGEASAEPAPYHPSPSIAEQLPPLKKQHSCDDGGGGGGGGGGGIRVSVDGDAALADLAAIETMKAAVGGADGAA
jgi:hypothetical protein